MTKTTKRQLIQTAYYWKNRKKISEYKKKWWLKHKNEELKKPKEPKEPEKQAEQAEPDETQITQVATPFFTHNKSKEEKLILGEFD